MNTEMLKATVEKEFPGLKTKEAKEFAALYLQLPDNEKDLFLTISEMIIGNPARREFAANWKGCVEDLPAALAAVS